LDVSQGREPKRDFRRPLSKRWRIVARCAAVLVAGFRRVLAVHGGLLDTGHRFQTLTEIQLQFVISESRIVFRQ
jgi:hypothetical protein